MSAAVYRPARLDAVAEDAAAAVPARRGERLDGTLEAIEGVGLPRQGDGKGLIVVIAAGFAPRHGDLLPLMAEDPVVPSRLIRPAAARRAAILLLNSRPPLRKPRARVIMDVGTSPP
jgi:hypothetical protein